MPSLKEKHSMYIFGVISWTIGFLAYVVAFSLPTWNRTETFDETSVLNGGLWQHTCEGLTHCQSYPVTVDNPYFQACRSVACVALVLYGISAVLIFIHNCTVYGSKVQTENNVVSVLPIMSGTCGLTASILYVCIKEELPLHKIHTTSWGLFMSLVANSCGFMGGFSMIIGSCIMKRRLVHETRRVQTFSAVPAASQTSPPFALIAVPVSMLSSADSQTNLHVPTAAEPSSRSQNITETYPVLSPAAPEPEIPRANPSAPPPEYFYY